MAKLEDEQRVLGIRHAIRVDLSQNPLPPGASGRIEHRFMSLAAGPWIARFRVASQDTELHCGTDHAAATTAECYVLGRLRRILWSEETETRAPSTALMRTANSVAGPRDAVITVETSVRSELGGRPEKMPLIAVAAPLA